MKLLKIKASNFKAINKEIELDLMTSGRRAPEEYGVEFSQSLENLTTNNLNIITGANSSGKTTILEMVHFIVMILEGRRILRSRPFSNENNLEEFKKEELSKFKIYFEDNEKIYYYKCEISKTIDEYQEEHRIERVSIEYINEELMEANYNKEKKVEDLKFKRLILKENLKAYTYFNDDEQIYPIDNQTSIMSTLVKEYMNLKFNVKIFNGDTQNLFWNPYIDEEYAMNLINTFDPNIEIIKINKKTNKVDYKIAGKIKRGEDLRILIYKLSLGSRKLLKIINKVQMTIEHGGILLLDEIENSFHITISKLIIRMFIDPMINRNGAILIATTHSMDIIDLVNRKDQLWITNIKDHILELNRASKLSQRSEIKSSNEYIQGIFKSSPTKEQQEDIIRYVKSGRT